MVSALDSGSGGRGSSLGRGCCVVFLGVVFFNFEINVAVSRPSFILLFSNKENAYKFIEIQIFTVTMTLNSAFKHFGLSSTAS